MKNIIYILFCILLPQQILNAQTPDILWTKNYEFINVPRIIETYNHDLILSGSGWNGELVIARTNSMGDTLWKKEYYQYGRASKGVFQTPDSNFIIAASTQQSILGTTDICILKTNEYGDTIWTKIIGTDSSDYPIDVQPTSDNGHVILASSSFFSPNQPVLWLIKTDINFDTTWSKILENAVSLDPFGYTIIQTSDSGYILTGETIGNNGAILLLKLDNLGNIEWRKVYDLSLGGDDGGVAVMEDNNGYLILDRGNSVSLLKTDFNGDSLWTKKILSEYDFSTSMQSYIDSTLIITGYYLGLDYTGWILNVDNSGNLLWKKGLNSGQSCGSIQSSLTLSDSCLIAMGVAGTYFPRTTIFKLCPVATKIDDSLTITESYYLFQNYPNPFNPATQIKYTLPISAKVKIEIFNLLGQKIETLSNKQTPAGSHEIEFTAKNLPSGVYLYRIEAGEFQEVKKMILLR